MTPRLIQSSLYGRPDHARYTDPAGPSRPGRSAQAAGPPGADGLMIQRWIDGEVGPIHRLYPYKDPITGDALTDRPERASDVTRRIPPADAAWTGVDAVSLGLAKDQAHAEVTQWIIRHSEALIAFWDGEQMTKPGGTG